MVSLHATKLEIGLGHWGDAMATGRRCGLRYHLVFSVLAGAMFGGALGYASAQDANAGFLNLDCAARCAANGYDAEFCGQVCWVPDPAATAAGDQLDWKCIGACGRRGGTARQCMAACPLR